MRLVSLALLLLTPLALASAEAREWKQLRVATDGAYPPFSRIEAGQPVGFDVDVARAVCARLQAQCEIVAPGWDELVPALLARRVDLVVASQPISEEARRRVEFTAPYYRIDPRFVARETDASVDLRPAATAGRRIGVRAGTAHAAHLAAVHAPAGARIEAFPTEADALKALAAGRLDLVFGDTLTLYGLLDRPFVDAGLRFVGAPVDSPRHFGTGAGISLRREDADLGRLVDKVLVDLDRDGTLDRLVARHFPFAIR